MMLNDAIFKGIKMNDLIEKLVSDTELLEKKLDKYLEEIKYWKSIVDQSMNMIEHQQLEIMRLNKELNGNNNQWYVGEDK